MRSARKALTNANGDVRELTSRDFARMRPALEVLAKLGIDPSPPHTIRVIPAKQPISIRLSADVLSELRARGKGWQTTVDDILREWLKAQNGHAANGKNGSMGVKRTPRTVGRAKAARPATPKIRA